MRSASSLAFGYAGRAAAAASRRKMDEFARLLGQLAGVGLTAVSFDAYDALADAAHRGFLDLAWMPPIPFLTLWRRGEVTPVVAHHRGGASQFHGVLIVRADSPIRNPVGLRGTRAAWVDRRSASGFVLPRVELAHLGVDPRTAFASERFYGSHEAVVRAVVGGRADFAATYARLDRSGAAVNGAWVDLPGAEESVRVLIALGKIPGDVTAARHDLDPRVREAVTRAMVRVCHDVEGSMLVRDAFGVHEFRRWRDEGYDAFRNLVDTAAASGLLDHDRIRSA